MIDLPEAVPAPEITLGCLILDSISGIQGYAVSSHEILDSQPQWGMQPVPEFGSTVLPDIIFLNKGLADLVGQGISFRRQAGPATDTLQLGEQVTEDVSGFTGIAIERITYINGSILYYVLPKTKKKNTSPEGMSIDHLRLKKIGNGVLKKATKKKVQPHKAKPKPAKKAKAPNRSPR